MSVITDVAIVSRHDERAAVASINEWLAANHQPAPLGPLQPVGTGEAGGGKVFTSRIWAGSFNFLDNGGFEDAVRAAPWSSPANAFAYISYEHGSDYVICPSLPGEWPPEAARLEAGR